MTPDEHYARLALAAKLLVGVALLIAAFSLVRYVADCTAHPQLGIGECAAAWFVGPQM